MSYRLLGGSAICAIGVTLGALQAAAQPANDNFAAATLIAGNAGTNSATTASATVEAGEPPHSGVRANSVWFVWTATNNTVVTFSAVAGNFDPVIAAYSGTNVTSLTRVAANDDAVVGLTSSRISFTAVKDVEYRIAVDRFSGTAGNFSRYSSMNVARSSSGDARTCEAIPAIIRAAAKNLRKVFMRCNAVS